MADTSITADGMEVSAMLDDDVVPVMPPTQQPINADGPPTDVDTEPTDDDGEQDVDQEPNYEEAESDSSEPSDPEVSEAS